MEFQHSFPCILWNARLGNLPSLFNAWKTHQITDAVSRESYPVSENVMITTAGVWMTAKETGFDLNLQDLLDFPTSRLQALQAMVPAGEVHDPVFEIFFGE